VTASSQPDFDTFVAARAPALGRTAYLLTGDRHLAEDLVQTALFKAARVWHRIHGDPEPYVRRILYTQNVSWWRSRRHREVALGRYDAPATSHDPDVRLVLVGALAALTPRQRTVITLRYFEDLSVDQTADALGVRASTVKTLTQQALARLRASMPELADLTEEGS
jgi:RNA polymerase sigma-70 factor (sigma-E family)